MNGDLFTLFQGVQQISQDRARSRRRMRHSSVRNWKMDKPQTVGLDHLGLLLQLEPFLFRRFEE
jgi:hypothetical protein